MRCRGAFWPARSAGMNVHARPRWSASRPEEFSSEMRSRGVVLTASRISVPSPATPCTLITPNGAPHGPISRICFLPFTGANAGV